MSDLPKPYLLHTMPIGMHDHFQKWIFHFMKAHERLDKYNAIWSSVLAYHDLTPKTKSDEEVSQWNVKKMKEMGRYLLGVVTQSLRLGGSPAQRPILNGAIDCTRALLEFNMYARYKSHDDDTLSYMEDTVCRFHTFEGVSFLGQAGRMVKAKANALRTELVQKRKVDEKLHAETRTPSKKQRKMNAWQDYISHGIDVSKESDADFNVLKIDLMSHWVEQICRYGAFQQYSAERNEQAHKTNLKDGWNASNHNPNYLPQVITFQRRILCFDIRELNLQALTQRRENSAATRTIFLLALIWLPPWAPRHMRSQNSWDPKTAVMESILMLWSKTSEHYSTIPKTQHTVWQYTTALGSFSSIRVVTRRIYRMNNCTQWSSVFAMVSRFKLRV